MCWQGCIGGERGAVGRGVLGVREVRRQRGCMRQGERGVGRGVSDKEREVLAGVLAGGCMVRLYESGRESIGRGLYGKVVCGGEEGVDKGVYG